jgi:hypothetical protein
MTSFEPLKGVTGVPEQRRHLYLPDPLVAAITSGCVARLAALVRQDETRSSDTLRKDVFRT